MDSEKEYKLEYEARQKALYDYNTLIDEAKQNGEHNKAIEIAVQLLSDGLSLEKVVKYTGLTIEQIKALKKLEH